MRHAYAFVQEAGTNRYFVVHLQGVKADFVEFLEPNEDPEAIVDAMDRAEVAILKRHATCRMDTSYPDPFREGGYE